MRALPVGAVVTVAAEVEARRRGRPRRFPEGSVGRVVMPPEGGYVVVELDASGYGAQRTAGWIADVPVRCVVETRTGVAA